MTKPNHDRKTPTFAHISAVVLAIQRSIRISLKTRIHTSVIVRRTSRLLKTGKMFIKHPCTMGYHFSIGGLPSIVTTSEVTIPKSHAQTRMT